MQAMAIPYTQKTNVRSLWRIAAHANRPIAIVKPTET
jgi:hypothetical protein